jgi:hypothetical protein
MIFDNPLIIFQEIIEHARKNNNPLEEILKDCICSKKISASDSAALLRLLASTEENDMKAFGMHAKAERLVRENINQKHIDNLKTLPEIFKITDNKNESGFLIENTTTKIIYEYFLKANKISKRKASGGKSQWFHNGHKILIDQFNLYKK